MFVDKLIKELEIYNKEIYGSVQPFCDKDKQGLMLSLTDKVTNEKLFIWCSGVKDEDSIMILTSKEKSKYNLYMKDDIDNAQYFDNMNFEKAIKYSLFELDRFLGKEMDLKL